ncbi:nuclear pore complex protein Nup214-like isoform X4 [Epinephelus moara]|uniref:nuclear pore complex protein Nup214-like isoform X4 n=1 Tax=Epinephelus moara TaxID=300413 RepID=UPI00214E5080|nr:nuclear pore complex protein Nup214-like isoform X4 [Epinephelus moara]
MSDDTDTPPEREMKDFQFRQMKKARVFDTPDDFPKERTSLLTISNKFGLTFVGLDRTFKVYQTQDILAADKIDGNANDIVEGMAALAEVTVELALHHLALSCDELTLSVCGMSEEASLSITFYDVRTFMNKARPQKLPFGSLLPAVPAGTLVQDLKWNPVQASILAVCLSDGQMMILEVNDSVKVQAGLPASTGVTCICWSPKGKQVAAGKMNSTVSQYTPGLEEKKVILCPNFYTADEPVKVLDVLWLRTFVFAVVYAAADGSLETPPELVLITIPKKDEKVETKYLNFSEVVFGSCTERQHHYFLSHIEDWDLMFAASAAAIEVSVIAARQEDKIWELWVLEDASRAELPVTDTNEDTLPLGLAIDFTSRQEIHITDEKTLPPAPVMLMLSTEGLLCPFALLNLNPGVKQLVSAPAVLALEGERPPKPVEECKRRWKQLRDSFVKNKNKTVPSGSAGGSQKDWKYSNNMSFLMPHLQPRSSKSTLRPVDLSEDTPAELMCEEDDLTAGPSGLPSRPGTPATPTLRSTSSSPHPTDVGPRSTQQLSELPRSANPPTHPRVQALSSGAETHTTQPGRKKRRGSTTAGPLEPDLLDILTTEETPVPPRVPKDEEEMYFFTLSLVPRLNRLPRSTQARAQIHILQYLTDLEKEEQDKLTQASPSVTRPTPLHW